MWCSSPVSRRQVLAAAALAPATQALLGCRADKPTAGFVQPVTYLTNFGALGRDAYPYLALEEGFFDEAGLAVTIEPGTGTTGNLQGLLAGRAQFATEISPALWSPTTRARLSSRRSPPSSNAHLRPS